MKTISNTPPRLRWIGCCVAAAILSLLSYSIPAFAANGWAETGPVIQMGDPLRPHILWNDPTVLAENGGYRMWLSGGDARDLNRITVSVYEARSSDGQNWQISNQPVVLPNSNPNAWDGLRIETPTVVRAGNLYHMYYTGFNEQTAVTGISQIGHATSTDGTNWVKDPRNPILAGQSSNPFEWGYGGVGEPGIVYNPRTRRFHLYYTGLRHSPVNSTIGQVGVLAAVSTDGSRFTTVKDNRGKQKLILTRDVPGATNGAWFGYSTPAPYLSTDGKFHLLVAFLVAPGGPTTARHVTLDRAESSDGTNFTVMEEAMAQAGLGDWKDRQVRAPVMVEANGQKMIWFAGERENPFGAGIGLLAKPSNQF